MKSWLWTITFLFFCPVVAFAGMYPVPISIKYNWNLAASNEFEVEWGWKDVPGLDAPPPSDYDVIVLAAHTTNADGGMLIGGGLSNSIHGSGITWAILPLKPGETMESAAQRIGTGLPTYFNTFNVMPSHLSDGCIGVVFTKANNQYWSNIYSPAGTCITIPLPSEPTVSCDVLTPSIALNHGEVGVGKTVSSIASADLSIDCRNAASANIKFESSTLKLGSMVATLSVPNAVNGNLQLNQGGNTLSVMSMLNGTALAVGTFTASTVMTITFN